MFDHMLPITTKFWSDLKPGDMYGIRTKNESKRFMINQTLYLVLNKHSEIGPSDFILNVLIIDDLLLGLTSKKETVLVIINKTCVELNENLSIKIFARGKNV